MKPKYYDARAGFWREHFERALPYGDYLASGEAIHAEKWRSMAESVPAPDAETRGRLSGHGRRLNVLVYSGIWCGDCVRQGPMLLRLAEAVGDDIDLRFLDRGDSESLQDELRILGALRVPVVVFLTEDFHEVGRFGDRLLTVYRAKCERELGEACSSGIFAPPQAELQGELAEWADIFERMLRMVRLAPPLRARYND